MDDRFKDLTIKLTNELKLTCLEFLAENLKKQDNTTDIINLILSSHLSSLGNLMKLSIEDCNNQGKEQVEKFIYDLISFISKTKIIEKVEIS